MSEIIRTNGWTALGVGEDIPAKLGQKFDVRLVGGAEIHGLILGQPCTFTSTEGRKGRYRGQTSGGGWVWNTGENENDVIAYRLHDPEDTAEQARREARIRNFRDIARTAPADLPHEDAPAVPLPTSLAAAPKVHVRVLEAGHE